MLKLFPQSVLCKVYLGDRYWCKMELIWTLVCSEGYKAPKTLARHGMTNCIKRPKSPDRGVSYSLDLRWNTNQIKRRPKSTTTIR